MLSVLIEMTDSLEKITDAELRRAERSLDEKEDGDVVLGAIHSPAAHRCWALAHKFLGISTSLRHQSQFQSDTEEEKTELRRESRRASAMAELCRDMFWVEARLEVAGEVWEASEIGVRRGWELVKTKPRPNPLQALIDMRQEEQ